MSKQARIAECEKMIDHYNNSVMQSYVRRDGYTNTERRELGDKLAHWCKELEAAQAMPDDTAQVDNARFKIAISIIQTAINEINIAMPKQRVMGSETYRIDQLIQVILDKSRKDS